MHDSPSFLDEYAQEKEPHLPTREVLSPAQRAELLTVPSDLSDRELARYYTLTEEDRALVTAADTRAC